MKAARKNARRSRCILATDGHSDDYRAVDLIRPRHVDLERVFYPAVPIRGAGNPAPSPSRDRP